MFDFVSLVSTSLVSNALLSQAKSVQKGIFELVIDYQIRGLKIKPLKSHDSSEI